MDLWLQKIWYERAPIGLLLVPLGWFYRGIMALRLAAYRAGIFKSYHAGVPTIVVGNITAGGTGKTPLVLWLAQALSRRGYKPGIVSRGYGGNGSKHPMRVTPDADVAVVGDEPLLMARRNVAPVAIGADRLAAAALLIADGADLILSDDGLQHYRLQRDAEIAVVDGERGLGNRRCLPAGPLREPAGRLRSVDATVLNGGKPSENRIVMQLEFRQAVALNDARRRSLNEFQGERVHAVAGIGNPARFFRQLERAGLTVAGHAFPDHARISAADLRFTDGEAVLMTEKDAVKCLQSDDPRLWYVPVDARLTEKDEAQLIEKILGSTEHHSGPHAVDKEASNGQVTA